MQKLQRNMFDWLNSLNSQASYTDAVNFYSDSLYKSMHWSLSCGPSTIEGAGNVDLLISCEIGSFLERTCSPWHIPRTSLLPFLTSQAVIPGTVYLRQHIVDVFVYLSLHFQPQFFQPLTNVKSDFKYWSYDGLIIDSTNYSTNSMEFSLEPQTPLALGHIINHPSSPANPDLKPNVMVVPYEFSKNQGQHFGSIIPNQYISPEKIMYKLANNHVLPNAFVRVSLEGIVNWQSLGIISISEIEDEELFLDYRLPPKAQPAWYKQIDDCTLRRWNLPVEADKDLHTT